MTAGSVTLGRLHETERDPDCPCFVHRGRSIGWPALQADVATTHRRLVDSPATDWALFDVDAYPFAVALLAALGAGKRVWLPANATAGTESKLATWCDGWLGPAWSGGGEIPVMTGGRASALAELSGEIVVFTSGSTGQAQPIVKTLRQFDAEVAVLEQLWGRELGAASIMATVSHQHIYGLLFRVLWPLCAGRTIHSEMHAEIPDMLAAARAAGRVALVSSPGHLKRLQPDWPWADLRAVLATIFASGGPLPAEAAQACHRLAGSWPVEVYGSSESGGIAWRTQADGNAHWTAMPGVEIGASGDRALQVRSPHLPDDAWLIMSDAVELAGDGRFVLGDRLDRIVKVEGKRLSLPEMEQVLAGHPWLEEVRALLLRRHRESVAVVATLAPDGEVELRRLGRHAFARRLRTALQAHFDAVTLPRLWRFLHALPTDAQGKVREADLAALFARPLKRRLPRIGAVRADASGCEVELAVPEDLACFEGHFPGIPILPGVLLIDWAEQLARRHLGVTGDFGDLEQVKFSRLVRPGYGLTLKLGYDDERRWISYRFRSTDGPTEFASGRIRLGQYAGPDASNQTVSGEETS